MATFSSNAFLDQTTYTAAEAHTINGGATLTIAGDAANASGSNAYLGNITISEGTLLIDGDVIEIGVGSTTGAVVGSTVTGANGSGVITAIATGKLKLRSYSGSFLAGDAITASGYSATVSIAAKASSLVILGNQASTITTGRNGAFRTKGLWFELGVADGTASQPLTHYTTAPASALWVQQGHGITFTAGSATIASSHELTDGQVVVLKNSGGSLPPEFLPDTGYYVVSSNYSTRPGSVGTNFQLSATQGGSAIVPSVAGSGTSSAVLRGPDFTVSAGTASFPSGSGSLQVGDSFCVRSTGVLPSPLNPYRTYYRVSGGISLTKGGSPLTLTGGSGIHSILEDKSFVPYLNLVDRAFSVIGAGINYGRFFKQAEGSSAITFGNGTNGNIPPLGAIVRVQNVTIGTVTNATAPTPQIPTATTNYYLLNTTSGGFLDLVNTGFSGFSLSSNRATSVTFLYIGVYRICSFTNIVQPVRGIGLTLARLGTVGSGTPLVFAGLDDINIKTVGILATVDASNLTAISTSACLLQSINRGVLTDVRISVVKNNFAVTAIHLESCRELSIYQSRFIGSRIQFRSSSDCVVEGFSAADTLTGATIAQGATDTLSVLTSQGIRIAKGNLLNRSYAGIATSIGGFSALSSLSDLTIDDLGFVDFDQTNTQLNFISGSGRVETLNVRGFLYANTGQIAAFTDGASSVQLINSGSYTAPLPISNVRNLQYKGMRGNGFTVSGNNPGVHFCDRFLNATDGEIRLFFFEPTDNFFSSRSVSVISGTPLYSGSGAIQMRNIGDQVVWTSSYKLLGHRYIWTPTVTSNNNANYSVEYALDASNGTTFGAYKPLTAANVQLDTQNPFTGFYIRIRITTVVASPANSISNLSILTYCDAGDQAAAANHPISGNFANVQLTGLIAGSEVRVFRNSDGFELAGIENSGTTFSYTYEWESDFTARIVVLSNVYENIELPGVTLTSTGLTIPIQQRLDRTYSNP